MSQDTIQQVKVTLSAVRLTGEQSRRLMQLARDGTDATENWADGTLEQHGLIEYINIPTKTKAHFEHLIAKHWRNIQRLAKKNSPSEEEAFIIDGAASQIRDILAYRLNKKYVGITKAGRELAANGKITIGVK